MNNDENKEYNVPVQQLCHCSWSDCAGKVLIAIGIFSLVLALILYFGISSAVKATVDYFTDAVEETVTGVDFDVPADLILKSAM